MIRVLASDGMNKAAAADLRAKGYEVVEQFYEPEDLKRELANYDVLVVRSATKVREPIIDAAVEAGRLKLVIRGGVGVDNIDVKYAESKGLKVTNTPKASSDSVAELALGHMLAMARYISIANVTMREGKWEKKKYEGVELAGKTLGLIGMGRISQSIARKATALGMKVMYTDIFEIKGLPEEYVCATQEEVLKNADFVSLHIPAAKGFAQACGIVRRSQGRIAVGGGKAVGKQHQAVIPVQHHVTRPDIPRSGRAGWQALVQIAIFFIAVEPAHVQRHGQQLPQRPDRFIVRQ